MSAILERIRELITTGLQFGAAKAELVLSHLESYPPRQLVLALGVLSLLLLVFLIVLIRQRSRIRQAEAGLIDLAAELSEVSYELNVERVWRLAGTGNVDLPSDTLLKLYKRVGMERAVN